MAAVTLLSSLFNTTNGSKTTAGATPAVGDLIVIITAHTGNTNTTTSPTDSQGGSYELVGTAVKATSADTMQAWIRREPINSASSTTFTHNPGTTTGGGLLVHKVTGMTRTGLGAVRRVSGSYQFGKQDNQAAATPAPAFPAAGNTNNACIGAVFSATNSTTTQTPPASWTERFDNGYATPTTGIESCSRGSGNTATTITWGGASASAFCSLVLELDSTDPGIDIVHKDDLVEQAQSRFPRAMPAMWIAGSAILGALTSPAPSSTDQIRGVTIQENAGKPQVTALAYPNLLTQIPLDSPFFTDLNFSAPVLKRHVEDTSYGIPKTLFDDSQIPVGRDEVYNQPDRIRPVWDTSKSTAKVLYDDFTVPFKTDTGKYIQKINSLSDFDVGYSPVLINVPSAPFVPYDFSNVERPLQTYQDTSKGISKTLFADVVVVPPFVPPDHISPLKRTMVNPAWMWRVEGATDPAPQEPPIGAKALQQVPAWKPPVLAQNNSIPPDRIPAQPATPIPEGKQALTFSPHKRPQVFAEQHYIPPYLIIDSSIATAYPESQPIVRKPPRTVDTLYRNRLVLETIVAPPIVPWNFEEPQKVKWVPDDTSLGTPKTLTTEELPTGKSTPQSFNSQKKWQSVIQHDYRNWAIYAPVAVSYTITPSGGISFAGTTELVRQRAAVVSGSITFSGTNEFTHIKTYLPTGAITFSGTNSMQFLPFGSALPTTKLPMTGAGQT